MARTWALVLLVALALSGCATGHKAITVTNVQWDDSGYRAEDQVLTFRYDGGQRQWYTVAHITTSARNTPELTAVVTFSNATSAQCRTFRSVIADASPAVNDVNLWCDGFDDTSTISSVTVTAH